jgi:hypothetical protein
MKRVYLSLWLFAGLACVGLKAQSIMTADIPFNFQLGNSAMPAGQYQVHYAPGMLVLQNWEARKSAAVLTIPKDRKETPKTGILAFNRYGDTYFFAGVWTANSASGGTVSKTGPEKELVSRFGPAQPVTVALNKGQ